MSWQRSIQNAVRDLKKEETALRGQLETVQRKIAELQGMARSGGAPARKTATRRRLSPKGRAAISRAAKKRWREYRSQQRKQG